MPPQLVFEVAVSNESMPTLTITDLYRYFGPGTGTRAWIGIKVFKNPKTGVHWWWAGWARRMMVNGIFVNQPDMSNESMPIVDNYNLPINIPVNIIFHIDIVTLISPCQPPASYPQFIDLDLEQVRQIIVEMI
jgi:hypothetical protein